MPKRKHGEYESEASSPSLPSSPAQPQTKKSKLALHLETLNRLCQEYFDNEDLSQSERLVLTNCAAWHCNRMCTCVLGHDTLLGSYKTLAVIAFLAQEVHSSIDLLHNREGVNISLCECCVRVAWSVIEKNDIISTNDFVELVCNSIAVEIQPDEYCKENKVKPLEDVQRVLYQKNKMPKSPTCTICFIDFEDNQEVDQIQSCTHCFHTDCMLREYLVSSKTSRKCPSCNVHVL